MDNKDHPNETNIPPILRSEAVCEKLHFYQKSNALYVITYYFTQNYLSRGDRTIDQMVHGLDTEISKRNMSLIWKD